MIYKFSQLRKRINYEEAKEKYKHIKEIHLGQLKLLISEIIFLTKYAKDGNKVVYIGAAEGYHIPKLAELFPNLSFDLWDPASFKIKETNKIHIFNKFFKDRDAENYVKEHNNILFISDIRTLEIATFRKKYQIEKIDKLILNDMNTQLKWIQIIKPIAAYLKFRLPYESGKTKYLQGTAYLQAYSPSSTELRLSTANYTDLIDYDNKEHDEKMAYFNCCIRYSKIEYKRWSKIMDKYKIKNIWDNNMSFYVLDYYLWKKREIRDDEEVAKLFNDIIDFFIHLFGDKYNVVYHN
jgi:hypothetical protein